MFQAVTDKINWLPDTAEESIKWLKEFTSLSPYSINSKKTAVREDKGGMLYGGFVETGIAEKGASAIWYRYNVCDRKNGWHTISGDDTSNINMTFLNFEKMSTLCFIEGEVYLRVFSEKLHFAKEIMHIIEYMGMDTFDRLNREISSKVLTVMTEVIDESK